MLTYLRVLIFCLIVGVPSVELCKPQIQPQNTQTSSPHYSILNMDTSTKANINSSENNSSLTNQPLLINEKMNFTSNSETQSQSQVNVTSSGNGCPTIYSPVCGNDHKTYNSSCEFQIAQKNDPTLNQEKVGAC